MGLQFDWTINVGQVATVIIILASVGSFFVKHLAALQRVTDIQASMKEEMVALAKETANIERSMHSIDKRMVAVETVLAIKPHWAEADKLE